jgi:hypothetical protein
MSNLNKEFVCTLFNPVYNTRSDRAEWMDVQESGRGLL